MSEEQDIRYAEMNEAIAAEKVLAKKKRRAFPYKQFSKAVMRELGYMTDDAERKVPMFGLRNAAGVTVKSKSGFPMMQSKDLFGIFDLLCTDGKFIVGVQATSTACIPDHVRKIEAEPVLQPWLDAGGVVELHGWAKRGRFWAYRMIDWKRNGGKTEHGWFDKHGVPIEGNEE